MCKIRKLNTLVDVVSGHFGVTVDDVRNTGARIPAMTSARTLIAGLGRFELGFTIGELAEFLGFTLGTVQRWSSDYRNRRAGDPAFAAAEQAARLALELIVDDVEVPRVAMTPQQVEVLSHPKWTPAMDLALLGVRKNGRALDQIAADLKLQSVAVQQRFHRLRSVPGVFDVLAQMKEDGRPMDAPYGQVAA